jgi:hypothetical protein
MVTSSDVRIQPTDEVMGIVRAWLAPVRAALGPDFLAAYLTGSVLTQGFDPKHSHVNLLVVARGLGPERLDVLAPALPRRKATPQIEPLFMTREQIERSLDSFPIEWLEIRERHLLIEGEDVMEPLEVPRTYLRLQCEHELRAKFIQLRQAYLLHHGNARELAAALRAGASGFATLFRTLLRLREEPIPAEAGRVAQRVAEVYGLDSQALLVPHLARYSGRDATDDAPRRYRAFLVELERLVAALDGLKL